MGSSTYLADPDYFQQQFKAAREDIYFQQKPIMAASYANGVLPEDIEQQLLQQCHSNALEGTRQKLLARRPDLTMHVGSLPSTRENSSRPASITGNGDVDARFVDSRGRGPPPSTRGFDKIGRRQDIEPQLSHEIATSVPPYDYRNYRPGANPFKTRMPKDSVARFETSRSVMAKSKLPLHCGSCSVGIFEGNRYVEFSCAHTFHEHCHNGYLECQIW